MRYSNSYIYCVVQTNRATLQKYIAEFKRNITDNEELIAPRPLLRQNHNYYHAYIKAIRNGANHIRAKSFKNYKEIDESEYKKTIQEIEHSWRVNRNGT